MQVPSNTWYCRGVEEEYECSFFTSDLHIESKRHMHRHMSKKQAHEAIVEAWNKTVTESDTVFILGDIGDRNVLHEINGRLIIVLGNHEKFETLPKEEYPNVEAIYPTEIIVGDLLLSHPPIMTQRLRNQNEYVNIHGHEHYTDIYKKVGVEKTFDQGNRWYNCGIDLHHLAPVSEDRIREHIQKPRSKSNFDVCEAVSTDLLSGMYDAVYYMDHNDLNRRIRHRKHYKLR